MDVVFEPLVPRDVGGQVPDDGRVRRTLGIGSVFLHAGEEQVRVPAVLVLAGVVDSEVDVLVFADEIGGDEGWLGQVDLSSDASFLNVSVTEPFSLRLTVTDSLSVSCSEARKSTITTEDGSPLTGLLSAAIAQTAPSDSSTAASRTEMNFFMEFVFPFQQIIVLGLIAFYLFAFHEQVFPILQKKCGRPAKERPI